MRRTLHTLLVITALAWLATPAAHAASRTEILRDCAVDGRVDGRYTAEELRDARKNMPTDGDEYSDCRAQLRAAELAAIARANDDGGSGSGSGSGGGTGGAPATPDAAPTAPAAGERGALLTPSPEEVPAAQVVQERSGPVTVGDTTIVPGATGVGDTALRDLPVPVLVMLALLGLSAAALALPAIRRRLGGLRGRR